MSWLDIAGLLFLALLGFAGTAVFDEGRRDLRHGIDGHPKLVAGVCIVVLAVIGAVVLTVLEFAG